LVAHFLRIVLLVGLVGGLMPAGLFALHTLAPPSFRVALYALVLAVGVLVGLEIPLVMRILKRHFRHRDGLKDLVSQVLTFDYLGALVVAIAFPLLFVPTLGLVRTGVFFGLMNAGVALWALWLFRAELRHARAHALACAAVTAALGAAFVTADRVTTWAEDRFYGDNVVYSASSPYQRVIVTASKAGVRLFLNGNLQFHSRDEYRYHEALVHPAMAAQGAPRRVLILGGGDGLAAREVLKYPSVKEVTLVDLDAHITTLFATEPMLRRLNADALRSSRLKVVNDDAFSWLERHDAHYDVIVVDFPDPTNYAIGKLYTTSFYQLVDEHLAAGGFAVVQTTSPLIARRSFWTVVRTLEAAGLTATPYHAHVPSFGEWGFVLASRRPFAPPARLPEGLRFLTVEGLPALFNFPPDMARVAAEPNRLSNQVLVPLYEQEWGAVH
jgi:spermidine synthase